MTDFVHSETIVGWQLAARVRRSERRRRLVTLLLLAPSVIFVALFFIAPVGLFLFRSVDNSEIPSALVRTVQVLGRWNGADPVPDEAFTALARDLTDLRDDPRLPALARRLNYNIPQFRGLILRTRAADRSNRAKAATENGSSRSIAAGPTRPSGGRCGRTVTS